MSIRWGILGAGKIASDFTTALSYLDNVKVVAVAARSKERAEQFGEKFKIPKRYGNFYSLHVNNQGSYEELARDPDIDIIYISTIHPEHHSNALLCIQHGKNVLCEKSFTINARQASEVIEAAKFDIVKYI